MNWSAHPTLYQLTHWWHWLAYGQNAAVVALIGLILYTYYTQRMMRAAEETRRLALTPFLLAEIRQGGQPAVLISNVGAPAVRCEIWAMTVSNGFSPRFRVTKPVDAEVQYVRAILSQSEAIGIPMVDIANELVETGSLSNVLYVVDCYDTIGGKYQLQLLQAFQVVGEQVEQRIGHMFLVPDTHLPSHRFLYNRVLQLATVGMHNRQLKKIKRKAVR